MRRHELLLWELVNMPSIHAMEAVDPTSAPSERSPPASQASSLSALDFMHRSEACMQQCPDGSPSLTAICVLQLLVAGCQDGLRVYSLEVHLQPSDVPLVVSDPHKLAQPGTPEVQQQPVQAPGGARLHVTLQQLARVRLACRHCSALELQAIFHASHAHVSCIRLKIRHMWHAGPRAQQVPHCRSVGAAWSHSCS